MRATPFASSCYTLGNVESEYEPPPIDAGDPRTLYSYDIDRRLDFVERPGGTTVDLAYDASGRLETLTTPTGPIAYGYDANTGNLTSITAPGGEDLTLAYDGALPTATTWSGTVAGSVARSFDPDFRIATETVGGTAPVAFAYDDDGLLTGAGALAITRDADTGLVLGTSLGSTSTSETPSAFGELDAQRERRQHDDLRRVVRARRGRPHHRAQRDDRRRDDALRLPL